MMEILLLVWIHYVADFLMQPRYVAESKSTDTKMLAIHCLLYSLPFLYFGIEFAVITALLHFVVDWPSSRAIRHYWYKGKKFVAFGLIGLDQALHLTALILTLMHVKGEL